MIFMMSSTKLIPTLSGHFEDKQKKNYQITKSIERKKLMLTKNIVHLADSAKYEDDSN